ncbi:hypothetical protein HZS_2983 [Henneguya salminicola]|nr:hypothetical protein HZS_2983 [Henneguya salminicola]
MEIGNEKQRKAICDNIQLDVENIINNIYDLPISGLEQIVQNNALITRKISKEIISLKKLNDEIRGCKDLLDEIHDFIDYQMDRKNLQSCIEI